MFTDDELADLGMALDMATGEVQSPLTPHGIAIFTILRGKVSLVRSGAPNTACSGLPIGFILRHWLAGKFVRLAWWLAGIGSR